MGHIDTITRKFIEPLNDATKRLLSPIKVAKNDHLHVELDSAGKRFVFNFYAKFPNETKNMFDESPEIRRSPSWRFREFINRIPERKRLFAPDKEKWMVAGTDFTAILMNAIWPSDKITFDKDSKLLYDFLLLRFLKQTINSRVKAAYKLKGEIPDMPDDFIDHPEKPLFSFQKVALMTSIDEEGTNLWMEQGTGKTPIIIARICLEGHRVYQKEKRMYRALIVVPKSMRMNWHNKFIEFATRPGKLTVLRGGQLTRVKLMVEAFKADEDSEYTVVICSYGSAIESWEALRMIEWDLCTLDEAHMIKGYRTKRWAKMRELRELCKQRSGLTGTPLANKLFDCFTQLEWLGEGLSGFTSYKSFKSFYGQFINNDGHEVLTGYQNLPLLQERFSRLCFMITRDEAMPELPKKTYDVLEVEMTKFQRDCYVSLQKQLVIEIEQDLFHSENKMLTANHILTKLLRLSQITAGYLKWDAEIDSEGNATGGSIQAISPNPKIDMLVELLKNKRPQEKTIIWTNWVWVILALSKRFAEEDIKHVVYYGATNDKDRQIAEDSYNKDPSVKVFIGNPTCGGIGLDLWGHWPAWVGTDKELDTDTTQEIYYSQNWSLIDRSQSEDRPVRIGTRVSVQVTDMVVPNSIDEEIALRVLNKRMTALELQDIKDIMTRILNAIPNVGENDE